MPGSWALVTSNYDHRVRARFARSGLPLPAVIVDAAADVPGKPSPDPYLLAADLLAARPDHCLVVEDSPSGVQAGLRAGMTVWSVNAVAPVRGAHRHFRTLGEASLPILAFARRSATEIGSAGALTAAVDWAGGTGPGSADRSAEPPIPRAPARWHD